MKCPEGYYWDGISCVPYTKIKKPDYIDTYFQDRYAVRSTLSPTVKESLTMDRDNIVQHLKTLKSQKLTPETAGIKGATLLLNNTGFSTSEHYAGKILTQVAPTLTPRNAYEGLFNLRYRLKYDGKAPIQEDSIKKFFDSYKPGEDPQLDKLWEGVGKDIKKLKTLNDNFVQKPKLLYTPNLT
jgi:hypothetical protein